MKAIAQRIISFVVLAILVTTSPASAADQPALDWKFNIQEKDGFPSGTVDLIVDGKSHRVMPGAAVEFTVADQSEFESYKIPKEALTAAVGWYAGAGDVLYVIRNGDKLEVFRREMDSQEESPAEPKKIATIGIE